MVLLSEVVERHQGELERLHGAQLLPSHRQALQAMRCCRRQGGDLMVLQCGDCHLSRVNQVDGRIASITCYQV